MVENGLRNQRIAVWDGPGMLLIWAVALLAFARSVPPPAPTDSAQQIAAIFLRRSDSILIGITLTCAAAALLGPFLS
jgi:hypothetical protein